MNRYLEIQSQGVLEWLGRPSDFPAQKVFAGLLRLPHSALLNPATLAQQFGLELREFSHALFELNRRKSLQVTAEAHDHSRHFHFDVALLCEDLRSLAVGSPQLLLASADGLCLAQQGLTEETCIRQAALCHEGPNQEFPFVIPLHLGNRVVRLCSPAGIQTAGDGLLRLARRLISLPSP